MISALAPPSVCVVDDEEGDYQFILAALNGLRVAYVHIKGSDIDDLPQEPLFGLRLVFQDLHLGTEIGKSAASRAASVFLRLVSKSTAPVVVVIWSKYADAIVDGTGDQLDDPETETEADLFKRTLLTEAPEFRDRLIFVQMAKPHQAERPKGHVWIEQLKAQIDDALKDKGSVQLLWQWEGLVRQGTSRICAELTDFASAASRSAGVSLEMGLRTALQELARAQAEGDLSSSAAPSHLKSVLADLLIDHLEHSETPVDFARHGDWVAAAPAGPLEPVLRARLNALLLTSRLSDCNVPFASGAVYFVNDIRSFRRVYGASLSSLIDSCSSYKRRTEKWRQWRKQVKPVLVEISPSCDIAQGSRRSALLVAGLVVPEQLANGAKKADAINSSLQAFQLRWTMGDFETQDVRLVLNSRYRLTLPAGKVPAWLTPWFRVRELPTSALRNWHAALAARIGYVAL